MQASAFQKPSWQLTATKIYKAGWKLLVGRMKAYWEKIFKAWKNTICYGKMTKNLNITENMFKRI